MHSNLRDQKLKISTYMNRLVYINLIVTTSQKKIYIIDTHRKRSKDFKHSTKDTHETQGQRAKEERSKKISTKQPPNN